MDSSPLLAFARDARETYFGFRPTLPPVPDAAWILLDRLKLKAGPNERTERQTAKRTAPIPNYEANILVANFLRDHPRATANRVAKAVQIAQGRLPKLAAWKAEMDYRRETAKPKKGKPERPLTEKMLKAIGTNESVWENDDATQVIWREILETATPEIRAKLYEMPPEEKRKLIQCRAEQRLDNFEYVVDP